MGGVECSGLGEILKYSISICILSTCQIFILFFTSHINIVIFKDGISSRQKNLYLTSVSLDFCNSDLRL